MKGRERPMTTNHEVNAQRSEVVEHFDTPCADGRLLIYIVLTLFTTVRDATRGAYYVSGGR